MLVGTALLLTGPLSPAWADYNAGEACSTGGAFHTKNDSDAATHLICDGTEWVTSVVFDKDGPVGIGTASPDTELEVAGDISAEQYCDEDGGNCFSAASVGGGSATAAGPDRAIQFNNASALNGNGSFVYSADGRVGIGTDNPQETLDLVGEFRMTGDSTTDNGTIFTVRNGHADDIFVVKGKGSISMGRELHLSHAVHGDSSPAIVLEGRRSNPNLEMGAVSFRNNINSYESAKIAVQKDQSGDRGAILFYTAETSSSLPERLRIGSDGNVGIGTTEPDTLLDVAGDISAEQYCDEDGENCFSAASVGSAAAAGPDRAIQFNNSSALAGNGEFLFTSAGSVELTTGSATTIGMLIKGVASQSANLFEFQSAGSTTPLARVTKDGGFSNNQGFTNSEAFGDGATLTGQNSVVIGKGASGGGSNDGGHSVIIGAGATGTSSRTVVIGSGASGGGNAVVIGRSATGLTGQSISIGAAANGDLAIGWNATSLSEGVAIGGSSSTTGVDAVAVGEDATATRLSVAVGHSAAANSGGDRGSVAIGYSASNNTFYSTAIGRGAVNTAHHQFVGGGSDAADSKRTDIYFGNGVVNAAPVTTTYHGSGGSGTDIAGADLALAGGRATGNAIGGSILFQTSDAGASGTTLRSLSTKMTLTAAGNLGIGTSAPTAKLHVDGDIHYTGAVADVSDRRLKDHITPLTDQLVKVTALQPVSFVMKGDLTTELGLIAQDVEPLFPELVKTNPDGMMTLNYVGLIGPMIAAMQEQQARIDELKAENDALSERLRVIEALLDVASPADQSPLQTDD